MTYVGGSVAVPGVGSALRASSRAATRSSSTATMAYAAASWSCTRDRSRRFISSAAPRRASVSRVTGTQTTHSLTRRTLTGLAPDQPPDALPPLFDGGLGTEGGGLVVAGVEDRIGGVLLLGDAVGLVVAVGVALLGRRAVSQDLRPGVVRVAQVRWDRPDLAGAHVGTRRFDGGDHGVGLGSDRQRDGGLCEVEPALGHADELDRLGSGHGGRER